MSVVDGSVHLALTTLSVGEHQLTASFDGTGGFVGTTATADPVAHVVLQGQTTTSLGVAPEPSIVGGSVTLTATVWRPARPPARRRGR